MAGHGMATLVNTRTSKVHVLGGPEVMVGRNPSSHVRVLEKEVSRTHCLLTLVDGGWVLSDAGSMIGTSLNGQRVVEPRRLATGDEIKVGNEVFRFDDGSDQPHKPMTLRPLSEATLEELVPFDIPGRKRRRRLPVIAGLAIAAAAVGALVAVLVATRQTPSQALRRAVALLRARDVARLWEALTDERRQALTYEEFRDQVRAVPDAALAALHALRASQPRRTEQGMVVEVFLQFRDKSLSGEVVLFRQGGEWRIHSAPTAWLKEFQP